MTILAGCTGSEGPDSRALRFDGLECMVCDHALATGPYTWEPSGAVDPTNPDHYAIAFRADDPSIEVHVTFDAGATWVRTTVPLDQGGNPYTNTGDAVTFFAPDGTLYVGGLGIHFDPDASPEGAVTTRAGSDIIVSRSDDGGRTFQVPVVVAQGGGTRYSAAGLGSISDAYQNQDRPWFAAGSDGRLVAAWNELGHDGYYTNIQGVAPVPYDGNVFQVAISSDAGNTWSAPQTLAEGGWPGATILEDGTFVVAHSSHQSGMLTLYKSADGATWVPTEGPTLLGQPVIRERGGDIIVAGTIPYDGGFAPHYRVLNEDGWNGPYIIGNASSTDPFTNLAVHGGVAWLSWYDNGVYRFAVLADPEIPWPTHRYVADAGFAESTRQYGDYVDTLGVNGRVYLAWGATQDGERRIHVSVY